MQLKNAAVADQVSSIAETPELRFAQGVEGGGGGVVENTWPLRNRRLRVGLPAVSVSVAFGRRFAACGGECEPMSGWKVLVASYLPPLRGEAGLLWLSSSGCGLTL